MKKTVHDYLDQLIGGIVRRLYFNAEKNAIGFELENGQFQNYFCHGECCSTSWIEHVSGLQSLVDHKITNIKYLDIDANREGDEWGEKDTLIYRLDIYTEAGICTIEMRNHSNGYYFGELSHEDQDACDYYGDEFEWPNIEAKEDF